MATMRYTIDTNCIIDVEESRPNAAYVRELIALNGRGGNVVAISAVGASERQRSGGYAATFSEFREKLSSAGLGDLELLPPLFYWDITYWDHCVWTDDGDTLEQALHEILFPDIEFLWVDFAAHRGLLLESSDKKWRNAKCDVLALWCHIKSGGDVFVTGDENFHAVTKISKLEALGAGRIVRPAEAALIARGNAVAI